MSGEDRGQVGATAAEVYEECFFPAIFQQWADPVPDAAGVESGHRVLDVGCGTGVVARRAFERVGPGGRVVGVDINDGMLAVARRHGGVEWLQGPAEDLPVDDDGFDAVVSQFAMMFFEDRAKAVAEMSRAARSGGRVAVAVWADVSESPGYATMADLFDELYGEGGSAGLRAPFTMGDPAELKGLLDAEFDGVQVRMVEGTAQFESIDMWVHTDIKGWTMAELSDDEYRQLLEASRRRLAGFANEDGAISFWMPALIGTGMKTG